MIETHSPAARTSRVEPGRAKLVPATWATYHADEMPKTGCERVELVEHRGELVVRFRERRAGPPQGRPEPAQVPSRGILSRS